MSLGGDASLLFFADPWSWLSHSSVTTLATGITGYNAQTQFIPFCLFLRLFEILGLNTQGVTFGVVLAMGYLGTRATCLELVRSRCSGAYLGSTLAGVICVSTPLVAQSQWSALLPRFLWLGLLPVLTCLLLQHQRAGGAWRIALAAALTAIFAPAFLDVPGALPAFAAGAAVVTVAWSARIVRVRVSRLLASATAIAVVNAFWLIPNILAVPLNGLQVASATSSGGKQAAVDVATALAPFQRAQDTLGLRQSTTFLRAFDSVQLQADRWPESFAPLGYVPVILIVLALVLGRTQRRLLVPLCALTGLFLYFQTLNVLPGGADAYVFLIRHVPGWTAVRNFYATWPLAFVFSLALTTGVAWAALSAGPLRAARVRFSSSVGIAACIVLIAFGVPFFDGQVFALDYSTTIKYSRAIDGLPRDFAKVIEFLKTAPAGNVLSLPLLQPSWTPATDAPGSDLYLGISPIAYLTGRSDYNGLDSFVSAVVPGLDPAVRKAVNASDTRSLAALAGTLGVRYVVVNTVLGTSTRYLGLGAAPAPLQEEAETADFVRSYARHVVATFGPWEVHRLDGPVTRGPVDLIRLPLPPIATLTLEDIAAAGQVERAKGDPCASKLEVRRLPASRGLTLRAHMNLSGCGVTLDARFETGWTASVVGGDSSAATVRVPGTKNRHGHLAFVLPSNLVSGSELSVLHDGRPTATARRTPGVSLSRVGPPPPPPSPEPPHCEAALSIAGTPARGLTVTPLVTLPSCALVLSEVYSRQWSATLTRAGGAGSVPLPVARINNDLVRFDLPADVHQGDVIRVAYRPNRLLPLYGVLSGGALAVILACAVIGFRRQRARASSSTPVTGG